MPGNGHSGSWGSVWGAHLAGVGTGGAERGGNVDSQCSNRSLTTHHSASPFGVGFQEVFSSSCL